MLASYVVLAVSLMAAANAYSTGAPESVCGDMVPKHPVSKQSSPPPYTITTSTKVKLHTSMSVDNPSQTETSLSLKVASLPCRER